MDAGKSDESRAHMILIRETCDDTMCIRKITNIEMGYKMTSTSAEVVGVAVVAEEAIIVVVVVVLAVVVVVIVIVIVVVFPKQQIAWGLCDC